MNSTMPKSGEAPSSPNAMPGGLGAILQQPGGAPKGASSRSIQSMIDLAQKMSDMQLADVLSGKSLDVPQYVAMTEAMGRKSLRTAVQGQQAQQQARQPSVKDKLLAEEAAMQMAQAPQGGIDQLPAPNMESVDMASGGIVAFQDNEDQPVRVGMPGAELTEEDKKALAENAYMQRVQAITNPGAAIANWWNSRPSSEELFNKASKARTGEIPAFVGDEPTVKGKMVNAGLVDRTTPIRDVEKVATANEQKRTALNAIDREEAAAGAGMTALLNAQQKQATPKDTDKRSNDRRDALAGNAGVGVNPSVRANPFGQLKVDVPDYERAKNQALGEGLMALSGAMFGNPDMSRALAQGLPTLAKISGASRKEISDLKKEYNSQQLNLAKANELYEQGQEDKAFKYFKQSQDNAYHMQTAMAQMMQAGKPSGQAELFRMVQKENPNMSALDIIAAMGGAKNEAKSDQALRDAYIKSPYLQAMYPNIEDYIKKNTAQTQVAGGGTSGYDRGVYDVNGRRI